MPIGNPVTLTSNVASKAISVTATASQTLFNVTGGYRINELGVFKNGLRLQDGVDYTARDGLTVTLLSAASGGDKLQFVVFDTFRVAEAIRPAVDEQTIRGNLNVVGILSASTLEGLSNFNLTSGITTFNDVRVGGALTVAGALTFEDVTNIDSVGIITAQSHVSIADSILHTGDTDTSIRFPAADTFTVETAGSERIRIRSNGVIIKGNSGTQETVGNGANTQLIGSGSADASLALIRQASGGGEFYFAVGTSGTNIADDNGLGFIKFMGYHTNGYDEYARIEAFVDGTNGDGDAPGRLIFKTSSDSSATPTERLRIDSAGLISIPTSGNLQVGGAGSPETDSKVYVANTGGDAYIQVKGADTTGTVGLKFGRNSVANRAGIDWSASTDALSFRTGGTNERVRITSGGNVGINSTSPGALFTVNTGGTEDAFRVGSPNGSDTIFRLGSTNTDTDTHAVIKYDKDDNYLSFVVSGESHGAGGVLIANGGNVGISSASPGSVLSVGGDMGLYRSGTQHGTYYIYKDNVATAWFKYRGDTNVVIIGNNAGDKLTINPSGDLNVAGITTATQLFEGTTRVATTGKAIAMAMLFG